MIPGQFLITFLAFPFLITCTSSENSLAKKVVLDVNGKQLTAQEFSEELAYRLKDQDALSAKDPQFIALTKNKILDDFLVQTLTENWAKENDVLVKAEELEDKIKVVQKSYTDDLAFKQALAEEGITFKAWRERLHKTLLQKLVNRKITAQATTPTEGEMLNYYNANKIQFALRETAQIRQILVATESDAKLIDEQLKKGVRLSELAKKYSTSPEGARGGDVGWIEKGLTDTFESAFRMKQGQRSPLIKSAFGYHVFEVTGRKPARTKAFTEVKDEIKLILMEKREQSLYLAWLEEQVRKARVFKDQDFVNALRVETKTR